MTPEHAIQNEIRKVAGANQDVMLWRNNVGMGWAGKSKKVGNTRVIFDPQVLHAGLCKGSSDLIGIRRVTITQEMVGTEVGVFMAVEIKQPDEYREVAIFRDTRLGHPSRRRERKIGDMPCLRRPRRPASATTRHFAGSPWLPQMALRRARLPYVLSQPAIRLRTSTKRTALTATRGSSHYASLHVLLVRIQNKKTLSV